MATPTKRYLPPAVGPAAQLGQISPELAARDAANYNSGTRVWNGKNRRNMPVNRGRGMIASRRGNPRQGGRMQLPPRGEKQITQQIPQGIPPQFLQPRYPAARQMPQWEPQSVAALAPPETLHQTLPVPGQPPEMPQSVSQVSPGRQEYEAMMETFTNRR